MPVSWPSTHGCASSRRRPAASASRCANRRTAASSANRMLLRRKPFPSSTHTASGAVTRTSVVPSAHSSGSRMPAPVSSVCSTRRLAQHLGVAEHPAGLGPDRVGHHRGPQRPRGFGRQPLAHPVDQRAAHAALPLRRSPRPAARRAPGGRPPRAADRRRNRRPPCSSCSASRGWGLIDASSGSPAISATSAARRPPGDGPRTTRPRLGLIAGEHRGDRRGRRARPHVARADHDDEIGCVQGDCGGIGETTREIANHGDPPAAAGVDDGVHRPGVQFVPAPGAREQADPAVLRQRLAHR